MDARWKNEVAHGAMKNFIAETKKSNAAARRARGAAVLKGTRIDAPAESRVESVDESKEKQVVVVVVVVPHRKQVIRTTN